MFEWSFELDKKITGINKTLLDVHSSKSLYQLTEKSSLLHKSRVQMTYNYTIFNKNQPFSQRLFSQGDRRLFF